jgi:hypothetical protein
MANDGSTKHAGNLRLLTPGQQLKWVIQRHNARRAGLHGDLRFGSPEVGGLYSWAIPKNRFPTKPGESVLALRQPIHRYEYGDFEGTIESGRGAGDVAIQDSGKVVITDAGPDRIRFALLHTRNPQEYALLRKKDNTWFLVNTTSGTGGDATKYGKVKYKATDDPEPYYREGVTASPKIDGAAVLLRLLKNRADVSSIRPSVKGGPIKHTWRVGGLDRLHIPRNLQGSVFRAELYGRRNGDVLSAAELGGLLNTATDKSIDEQRKRGVRLLLALYGAAELGTPVPKDRPGLRKLFRQVELATGGIAHPLQEADTPDKARLLTQQIAEGKHPLTREGVVFFEADNRPVKYVPQHEHDVYIREIFPAETKDGSVRAGGFAYSLDPDGPVVGEVGSGFIRTDSEDMWKNPQEWVGRKARIRSRQQHPSGAYQSPVFIARHEG